MEEEEGKKRGRMKGRTRKMRLKMGRRGEEKGTAGKVVRKWMGLTAGGGESIEEEGGKLDETEREDEQER